MKSPAVRRVLLRCADDSVIVLTITMAEFNPDDTVRWQRFVTEDVVRNEIRKQSVNWELHRLPIRSWRFVELEEVPTDRTFREAWTTTGDAVAVDMPKARTIHRDRMRAVRAPLLAALDVAYQRADEGAEVEIAKAAIVALKQALRDVTDDPAIETAGMPDELHAVWPVALGAR